VSALPGGRVSSEHGPPAETAFARRVDVSNQS
jgi:hypothetical protein